MEHVEIVELHRGADWDEFLVLRQTGRVDQQLLDRDLYAVIGEARKELRDRIIERKLAAIDQQQHGRRGELLRDARDPEICGGRAGPTAFDIGETHRMFEDYFSVVDGHYTGPDVRRQGRFNGTD